MKRWNCIITLTVDHSSQMIGSIIELCSMLTYGHDNGRISDHILASWPISMWAQPYKNKVQRIVVGEEKKKKYWWKYFWLQTLRPSPCSFAVIELLRARIGNSAFPGVCPTNKSNLIKTTPYDTLSNIAALSEWGLVSLHRSPINKSNVNFKPP